MPHLLLIILIITSSLAAVTGQAEELPDADQPGTYPLLEGEFVAGWEYHRQSSDIEGTARNVFLTADAFLSFQFTPELSVDFEANFDPVDDPEPGEFHKFESAELSIAELKLNYETEAFSLFAGKYDPLDEVFGGTSTFFDNFLDDLDLEGRIGTGAAITLDLAAAGEHTLSAHTFFLDTSILSESLFTGQTRNYIEDGEVSNTGHLNNYALTLQGGEFQAVPFLSYTLGTSLQRKGKHAEEETADEQAFFGGIYGAFTGTADEQLETRLEYLYLNNAQGEREDHHTVMLAAEYMHSSWTLSGAYGARLISTDDSSEADAYDHIIEAFTGYEFDNGLFFELGYQWQKNDDGEEQHSVGLLLKYGFDFAVQ